MNKVDLVDLYENEIRPNLPLEQVYSTLNPDDKGDHFVVACPICHQREAFVYKNSGQIICNRKNSCNASIDPIEFINGCTQPTGMQWVQAVKNLAAMANIQVPDIEWSGDSQIKHAAIMRKKSIRDSFQHITMQALNANGYPAGREYIKKRGLSPDQGVHYGIGYYPNKDYIKRELEKLGYSSDEIMTSGLYRADWDGRVVGPMKNLRHDIDDFWAVDLTGKVKPKYSYMAKESGASLDVPLGLDKVSGNEVIAVEGIFDCLTLDAHGIKNVIALGGSRLTSGHVNSLAKAKIKSITLLLDNDKADPDKPNEEPAGIKARREIIEKYANADFEIYVVSAKALNDAKDPDEFVRKYKIGAFKDVLTTKKHSFEYMAFDIAKRCNKSDQWRATEKIEAFDLAKKFEQKVTNNDRALHMSFFWEEFVNQTGIDQAVVDQHILQQKEKNAHAANQEAIKAAKETLLAIDPSDTESAFNEFAKITEDLNRQRISSLNKPIVTASSSLDAHNEMLAERWTREFIGLPQKTLPNLDNRLMGLRLFMLLAAAPNVGKTALAIQLVLDTILANEDTCALFVTFEMSTSEILSRIRCNLAGIEWRRLMTGFLTDEEKKRLDNASAILKKLNERFEFIDIEHYPTITFDDVKFKITDIKNRTGCKHVMAVIDYLQVWPIPDSIRKIHSSENDQDRWRIEQLKKIKRHLNEDPLLVISEARKPSGQAKWGSGLADIMGSSRSAYGPDVVFLLAPLEDSELADEWKEHLALSAADFMKVTKQKPGDNDAKTGKIIREFYAQQNEAIGSLCIEKGRDGMQKGLIPIKYNFEKNTFEELSWPTEAIRIANQYTVTIGGASKDKSDKDKSRIKSPGATRTNDKFDEMA